MPLVLYNGIASWNAAQDVADLVEVVPGGLERYSPRLQYFLLDERRLAESELPSIRNLAAAVFRLERSRRLEDVETVLAALAEWLEGPEQAELRRAFSVWLTQVLFPSRLPGIAVPQVSDLLEVKTMLAENAIDWTQEWKDRGRAEGRQEGLQEGLQQGLLQGIEKGRAEALQRLRQMARQTLETRFGDLPAEAHAKLAALDSVEELARLIARSATAASLAELQILNQ